MLWGSTWKASLIRTHAQKHNTADSYLLVKYGLTHGVVPLQRPCPICETFSINIICTESERRTGQKTVIKKLKVTHFDFSHISFRFSSVCVRKKKKKKICLVSLEIQDVNSCSIQSGNVTFFLLLRLIGRDIIRGSLTSCDFSHVCCQDSLPPSTPALLLLFTLRRHFSPSNDLNQAVSPAVCRKSITHVTLVSNCSQKMLEKGDRSASSSHKWVIIVNFTASCDTINKACFLKKIYLL